METGYWDVGAEKWEPGSNKQVVLGPSIRTRTQLGQSREKLYGMDQVSLECLAPSPEKFCLAENRLALYVWGTSHLKAGWGNGCGAR